MLSIVFEDNYLLAINKPHGLLSEGGRPGESSAVSLVSAYLKENFPWKKQWRAGLAHRLDRPATGVLLFAKTPLALKTVQQSFELRAVGKFYRLLVEGAPTSAKGELEHWLKKDDAQQKAVLAKPAQKNAGLCRLRYEVLQATDGFSLVQVELLTGKYHQIRAQMALSGCPVVGDAKYGATPLTGANPPPLIYLHANKLRLPHPVSKEIVEIAAPVSGTGLWQKFGYG